MLELPRKDQTPRKLADQAKRIFEDKKAKFGRDGIVEITRSCLPLELRDAIGPGHPNEDAKLVTFFWQRNKEAAFGTAAA